eukprot:6481874-Amphidinium_carterae.1
MNNYMHLVRSCYKSACAEQYDRPTHMINYERDRLSEATDPCSELTSTLQRKLYTQSSFTVQWFWSDNTHNIG